MDWIGVLVEMESWKIDRLHSPQLWCVCVCVYFHLMGDELHTCTKPPYCKTKMSQCLILVTGLFYAKRKKSLVALTQQQSRSEQHEQHQRHDTIRCNHNNDNDDDEQHR